MELNDPILITGCPRSGTSLISAIVNEAGAVGGCMNISPGKYNPTGFYENREIIDSVDKAILKQYGFDPMGQVKLPGTEFRTIDIRERVFSIAESQGIEPSHTWFFKDAKLLLLYSSYIKSFPGSKVVLVRRGKEGIVKSCMNTPFMAGRTGTVGWEMWVDKHIELMDELKLKHGKVYEIWYEDLIAGRIVEVKKLVEWLGLEYHEEFINSIIIKK